MEFTNEGFFEVAIERRYPQWDLIPRPLNSGCNSLKTWSYWSSSFLKQFLAKHCLSYNRNLAVEIELCPAS